MEYADVNQRKQRFSSCMLEHSEGVGDADGQLAMTRVELRPVIEFEGAEVAATTLADLHAQAHAECFIANSVTTEVRVVVPNDRGAASL